MIKSMWLQVKGCPLTLYFNWTNGNHNDNSFNMDSKLQKYNEKLRVCSYYNHITFWLSFSSPCKSLLLTVFQLVVSCEGRLVTKRLLAIVNRAHNGLSSAVVFPFGTSCCPRTWSLSSARFSRLSPRPELLLQFILVFDKQRLKSTGVVAKA